MKHERLERLVQSLLKGEFEECRPDELAEATRAIADSIARDASVSDVQVRKAMKILNEMREFTHSQALGHAWADTRGFDTMIQRQRAQALIELADLDAADELLTDGHTRSSAINDAQARKELLEYTGLLGRVAKQRFVKGEDANDLVKATDLYLAQYQGYPSRPFWHGINVVALRALEERLGLPARAPDVKTLARDVYADVQARFSSGEFDQWVLATASEASLALGDCGAAELWLYRFLHDARTLPFHIESFARQLREIWGGNALKNRSCADALTVIIERHVMRTQQRWSVSPAMVRTMQADLNAYEKNFPGESTFTVHTIKRMLEKCASIGCVTDAAGTRLGTGFLVSAASVGQGVADELVFLTNSHVISADVSGAIVPADAWVTFEIECATVGKPIAHKVVAEILRTSPPGDIGVTPAQSLDFTLARLETWPQDARPLKVANSIPTPSRKSKVFVVGHPSSGALQISLHDSELLDVCDDERLIHYRTPTDPGSSGSPVFNMDWEVVALHHAGSAEMPRLHGSGHYEANEGITLSAIKEQGTS